MKYVIIGTAGHVDHGKSAVIKALTGTDTDRLQEEKARGISIDLGFASLPLSPDLLAGIVDVPGHERFLKNMLAGTGGIDLAMLVIAADEGVMPQTREHLAMLELYGIQHGLVVINKIDKVEAEWLELVQEEIRSLLADTFLQSASFCHVSALTGDGIENLRTELAKLAGAIPARDETAPFRLWVDRVFTVKGHGVVVTGSVLSGKTQLGDNLQLYPLEQPVRVRGLESHGRQLEAVQAGQRAAINLAGLEKEVLARGMVLSAPARGQLDTIWHVRVKWQEEVASGSRVRLHVGTGEYLGRIYSFRNAPSCYMRLILEEPLAAGAGDQGILRRYSPQSLLGGVMLIGPGKRARKLSAQQQAAAEALAVKDVPGTLLHLLAAYREPQSKEHIRRLLGYTADLAVNRALQQLSKEKSICCLDNCYLTMTVLKQLTENISGILQKQHREQPEKNGLARETLRQKMLLTDKALESLLHYWLESDLVQLTDGEIALKAHAQGQLDWRQQLEKQLESYLPVARLLNIDQAFLAAKLQLAPERAKIAHEYLLRSGQVLRLGDMHVYSKTIQYIGHLIYQHFQTAETLTVAELRDKLQTSRKVAVPLLEYFDLHKYTARREDMRIPGPRIDDFSE